MSDPVSIMESVTLAPRTRPLIGRHAELDRLRGAVGLDPAVVEPCRVAVVSGDAGIGKSRLVAELAGQARDAGWSVVAGHCVGQAGSAIAYLPFTELLGALAEARPEVVAAVLAAHPDLGLLLPGHAGQSAGRPVDPGRVAEAVHAVLVRAGRELPLLAVVEDVHWADHSSRDLVTLLLTRGFSGPTGLVVTYRSDDVSRRHPLHETLPVWTRLPHVARVDLAALPESAMLDLVDTLADAPTDPDVRRDVVARAEGNAFFAEELIASGSRPGIATEDLSRLLRTRVEQLGEDALLLVRAAAVGGRTVGHTLLSAVSGLDDDRLDDAIDEAIERHVLEPAPGGAVSFRHALLGEAVAADVLPGLRRRLHRAYLAALQDRGPHASPAEIARHAAAVGDLPTALAATLAAGDAARAVGGPRDALRHYERALGWIEDPRQRAEVSLRAASAANTAGARVRAAELVREAVEATPAAGLPEVRAELLAELSQRVRILEADDDTLALSEEAMALLPADRDARRVRVLLAHLQALIDHRRLDRAAAVADELIPMAQDLGMPSAAAEARLLLAQLDELRGTSEDIIAGFRAVLAHVRAGDILEVRARMRLASALHQLGDVPAALEEYERGLAAGLRLDQPWGPYTLECRLYGVVAAHTLGRWDDADRLLGGLEQREGPQPGAALLAGAALQLRVDRGEPVPLAEFAELARWADVDSLVGAYVAYAAAQTVGAGGEIDPHLDLLDRMVALLDRSWSPNFQGLVRIAAALCGRAGDLAATLPPAEGARLLALATSYADRAAARLRAPDTAVSPAPGLETRAWGARLAAERLRLAAASGERAAAAPADPAAAVARWEACVTAYESYGHVPETIRARARLAEALARAGRSRESKEIAAQARSPARVLGMTPVLAILDALAPAGGDRSEEHDLTNREREVLQLVALGRTNGQIGKELFITTKTVSVHVSNLLAKLGAGNRAEAAAIARRAGLLD